MLFALLFCSCGQPRVKEPQVLCSHDATCCYKANKKSSICIKYDKQKKTDSTFIYFQFKQ